jgi:hypothetical protein
VPILFFRHKKIDGDFFPTCALGACAAVTDCLTNIGGFN